MSDASAQTRAQRGHQSQPAAPQRELVRRSPTTPGREATTVELQRRAGNRAVNRLLQVATAGPRVQRCAACERGGQKCEKCAREEQELRRAPNGSGDVSAGDLAPPIVNDVLRSGGQPLGAATRQAMEEHFATDLGAVRVHTGSRAAESARAVAAHAYTVGQHIVFNDGRYAPDSPAGRRLLAHELTHTLQQRNVSPRVQSLRIDGPGSSTAEREANTAAAALGLDHAPGVSTQPNAVLRRAPAAPNDALGGCGTCLESITGGMQIGGALTHVQIQAAAKVRYPWLLMDEIFNPGSDPKLAGKDETERLDNLLESLGKLAVESIKKKSDMPDLFDAVGEVPGGPKTIKIGEIKPDNQKGRAQGETQMKRYMRNLAKRKEYKNAKIEYFDLPLPTDIPFVLDRTRPKGCPVQKIHVRYWQHGIYLYSCTPPWKEQVKNKACKCEKDDKKPTKKKGKNVGFGIGINSQMSGGSNAGIGVAINSSGTANATAGAGVTYDSHGNAIGTASAGASVSSSGNAAGAAGVGASNQSHADVAGAAAAGTSNRSTAAGVGVASAGKSSDSNVIGAGAASKGAAKNVDAIGAGVASKGSAENVDIATAGTKTSGDVKNVEGSGRGGATGGTESGATKGAEPGGKEGEGSSSGKKGTGAGVSGDAGAGDPTKTAAFKEAQAEAQKVNQLLAKASPAQRALVAGLANKYPQHIMRVPDAAWVEKWLEVTKPVKDEHVAQLLAMDWAPPSEKSLDEFKKAIDAVVAGKAPVPGATESVKGDKPPVDTKAPAPEAGEESESDQKAPPPDKQSAKKGSKKKEKKTAKQTEEQRQQDLERVRRELIDEAKHFNYASLGPDGGRGAANTSSPEGQTMDWYFLYDGVKAVARYVITAKRAKGSKTAEITVHQVILAVLVDGRELIPPDTPFTVTVEVTPAQ